MTACAQPAAAGGRLIGLDLLRLMAVVLVIGAHAEACPYEGGAALEMGLRRVAQLRRAER